MSIVCDLERTNQLNLLPDQDLVDLCLPIESYQVTKNPTFLVLTLEFYLMTFCQRESLGIVKFQYKYSQI
ncbi:MAG: hypothetical protein EWV83_06575 [Microcystis sp. M_OC_Ca_00000000_S217Cul]|uniref:Uncharacterized protein n=2 Tax=Microcystis aeruginosa TaxID=1126 RepID=A0A841UW01_MICAE|nr:MULTISPECIES: hypothetical protein [Microcystis]TRT78479.1 MAG: hypothetical protein EWV83_06575 [Microcystis sp. M_OC_Ca_00000000_S217Cul]TRT82645.1 MAG: hypothetical protein EWV66_24540 [Microcystis sp. M_OC_Ca_00000000_C217Col]TRU08901.1 MAG: hypothetical protein EWV58_23080 [Microcystis aeruginosa Ma_MB_F_20061100_S19]TRU15255.1 MAG: hypothetical protein EWV59_03915 [Microcystis aeruginosa Ma_MB_F_20061100_S19D]TRU28465.1 MAG: hypothetical protein EWV79_02160 [Microcystis aeruginosa Ma_